MIPIRLMLRALTVAALTRGGQEPWPTMAQSAVFDSRLLPITQVEQDTMLPVICVYTDHDKRHPNDQQRRSYMRTCTLVIEIALSSVRNIKGEDGQLIGQFDRIETDPELEALLDLFEMEIWTALHDPTNPWATKWRKLVKGIGEWSSEPFRSGDQAHRYAVRQIVIDCEIASDCVPQINAEPQDIAAAPAEYLAELWAELASAPIFASTRAALQGVLPRMPTLDRVVVRADYIDPADPNRLPEGVTTGPDGLIDLEAHIQMKDSQ